ncbi:hypothetical protein GW915_06535 [bacterium]|nr:hypothetical protein [bacterium]
MKRIFKIALLLSTTLAFAEAKQSWIASESFSAPESVYYDPATNLLFVSSIHGEGTAQDGQGWISKVSLDGKVTEAQWITGLNAPKGMRSQGNLLYVSDIDHVVKIDAKQGKILKRIPIKGAKFLNDVAIDASGAVYVSDTLTSSIHIIKNDTAKIFVSGEEWESPNGLLVQGEELIVAAWGLTKDFNNKTSGKLYAINLKTLKRTNLSSKSLGNLDGLEADPKNAKRFYLSDWVTGEIFSVINGKRDGWSIKLPQGSADIALVSGEKSILVVPQMTKNNIRAYRLP